jgi:hypothetical protein
MMCMAHILSMHTMCMAHTLSMHMMRMAHVLRMHMSSMPHVLSMHMMWLHSLRTEHEYDMHGSRTEHAFYVHCSSTQHTYDMHGSRTAHAYDVHGSRATHVERALPPSRSYVDLSRQWSRRSRACRPWFSSSSPSSTRHRQLCSCRLAVASLVLSHLLFGPGGRLIQPLRRPLSGGFLPYSATP